jgi:hypothetical protein
MLTSKVYPNPFDNPELIGDLVHVATDDDVPTLELELVAERMRDRGYAAVVREGRIGPDMRIPDIKFATNPETGGVEGIDTSHGHRWTINYDDASGKYHFIDRKLGVHGLVSNLGEAKALALRAAGHETDNTKIDPYNEQYGAGHSSGAGSTAMIPPNPTVRPMYTDVPEPIPVEKLREMFPDHYLTK